MFLLEPNGSYVALRSSARAAFTTRFVHQRTKERRKSTETVFVKGEAATIMTTCLALSSDAEKKNASKKGFFSGKKNTNKAEIEKDEILVVVR